MAWLSIQWSERFQQRFAALAHAPVPALCPAWSLNCYCGPGHTGPCCLSPKRTPHLLQAPPQDDPHHKMNECILNPTYSTVHVKRANLQRENVLMFDYYMYSAVCRQCISSSQNVKMIFIQRVSFFLPTKNFTAEKHSKR